MARGTEYTGLLKDEDVRRWHENVARGSEVTGDVYLRRLGNFCEAHNLSPKKLAGMSDTRLRNMLMDFVSEAVRYELSNRHP